MEKFLRASKGKYRYNYKGSLQTEDLWDLGKTGLNTIYVGLKADLKETQEESLMKTVTKASKELEDKIAIVEFIYNAKEEEARAKVIAKDNRAKKQKLLEILANKQDQSLEGKSEAELMAMIEDLS